MDERRVGVLGASSLVGECLLSRLQQHGWRVIAYSRRAVGPRENDGVEWRPIPPGPLGLTPPPAGEGIGNWICVAPIWVLPDHFNLLKASGARRVVALSSTSRFAKEDSSDHDEQAVARRLAAGEARLHAWAEEHDVESVILRPTLIYGRGRDKNIAEMARFIRRFRFFPLLGRAAGLRQPVHAADVAAACVAALEASGIAGHAYNLSGGETLTYREMAARVFVAMGRRPLLLDVPLWMFGFAVRCLRLFPRYRHWSSAMAERMNRDLVFDHTDAARDLGFSPRPFVLRAEDVEGEGRQKLL